MTDHPFVSLSKQPVTQDGTSDYNVLHHFHYELPNWKRLKDSIFNDLSDGPPWGIKWWKTDNSIVATVQRILISDTICQGSRTVLQNLLEAYLHFLELEYWTKCHEDWFNENMYRPKNLLQAICPNLVQLHAVGVARALVSALDCVAAVVVGVLPLQMPKGKGKWKGMEQITFSFLRGNMRELIKDSGLQEKKDSYVQWKTGMELCNLISSDERKGWIDWLLQLRNTWIHRGRQTVFQVSPSELYGSTGLLRDKVTWRLPKDPDIHEVWRMAQESLLGKGEDSMGFCHLLAGDAVSSFKRLLEECRTLIDTIGKELLEVWDWRKNNCQDQPVKEQWPNVERQKDAIKKAGFQGLARNPMPGRPGCLRINPYNYKRLKAAALHDQGFADVWEPFFRWLASDNDSVR